MMISQIKSKKERNAPAKRAKFFTLEYLFLREDNAPIELCIIEIRCSGEGAGSGWTLEGEEKASGAMIVAASIYFYVCFLGKALYLPAGIYFYVCLLGKVLYLPCRLSARWELEVKK